jgi:glycosyltransferase involved in cell wall biosynthesis
MKRQKIIYFVTEDWYFCLHWLHIAQAAQAAGFEVEVVTRVREHGEVMRRAGLTVLPFEIARQGMNPFAEIATIARLVALYRRRAPDIVHNVAIKPTLYGSLAARIAGVRSVVNTLAGLGWLFTSTSLVARVLNRAVVYIFSTYFVHSVIVLQNNDDAAYLGGLGLRGLKVVRGAGVDLVKFAPGSPAAGAPLVVLPARMLWDKGIREFIQAARLLSNRGVLARFALVGGTDAGNPAGVATGQLEKWRDEGVVEWWGQMADMTAVYRQAHVVCLPSYREGLPTVLIEAAACRLPVVTTDTVGCREVVRHGENGFLVPLRNAAELADALQLLIEDPRLREEMGSRGREIAMEEFALEKIIAQTMAVYDETLAL